MMTKNSKILKNCKACDNDVAVSAKICPHCGKRLRMGTVPKVLLLLVCLFVWNSFSNAYDTEKFIPELIAATPSELSASGKLAKAFRLGGDFTDVQRENLKKEIRGKIVQWRRPVSNIEKNGDNYEVTTDAGIFDGGVRGKVIIHPQSDEERQLIESLKSDYDHVHFKGRIKSASVLGITIDPAVLVQ